jgi:multiple sugar transport system permease protein
MAASERTRTLRTVTQYVMAHGLLVLISCLLFLPVVWLLVTALKLPTEYLTYPITFLPRAPQWQNFVDVLTRIDYFKYMRNTVVLGLLSTVLTVTSSALAGYGFARFAVPGRNALFTIVIGMLLVPATVMVIPQFIIFSRLGLTNTYWPWVLWGLGGSAFSIFLFRQFFAAFPTELEEAASIDGCGAFRTFWQIFVPNAKPALATAAILTFIGVWGDWFTPLIYLSDENTTLGVKLATAYTDLQGNPLVPLTIAACVFYAIPPLLLFFLAQRYIVEGAVTSGLKG